MTITILVPVRHVWFACLVARRARGVEATGGDKEAMSVGADLLRCHKLFTNEVKRVSSGLVLR